MSDKPVETFEQAYPTPWEVRDDGREIHSAEDGPILTCIPVGIARRIVACVNWLQGLETSELEDPGNWRDGDAIPHFREMVGTEVSRRLKAEAQRDKLAEALREIRDIRVISPLATDSLLALARGTARQALAELEGGGE